MLLTTQHLLIRRVNCAKLVINQPRMPLYSQPQLLAVLKSSMTNKSKFDCVLMFLNNVDGACTNLAVSCKYVKAALEAVFRWSDVQDRMLRCGNAFATAILPHIERRNGTTGTKGSLHFPNHRMSESASTPLVTSRIVIS